MFHICLFGLWVLGGSREWWSWEHLLFLRSMECLYGINILFTHQHASVLYTLFATPCQLPSWFTWQMTKQNQNVVQRKNPTQIQPEYAWIVFCSHHIIYRFRGTSVSVGKNMCLYLYNISKLVNIGTMKWGNTISAWCRWLDNLQIHIYKRNTCLLMFIVSLSVCTTSSLKKKRVFLWCPTMMPFQPSLCNHFATACPPQAPYRLETPEPGSKIGRCEYAVARPSYCG